MNPIRLSEEDVARYREDGFLVLRGVFAPDEIANVAAETEALLARPKLCEKNNLRVRWTYHAESGEQVFELFDPIVDISPACERLARDGRIAEALRTLLGDEPCFMKDKLIYKPAGAYGYMLHQDFIAWPGFPESFTTVVIAIDPADAENGAIEVFPGAHAKGCLAERDGNFHILDDAQVKEFAPRKLDLAAGDVAIYGCFMPHRSGVNTSRRMRRHLLFSYNARADGGDLRAPHYEAFHHYLRMVYSAMGMGDLYFE